MIENHRASKNLKTCTCTVKTKGYETADYVICKVCEGIIWVKNGHS